ncbi:MAG: SGNH/GDSL hydrolase family protein [Clostridia bacterium]|nr:SGNH/GDSL hydrolase family protein [Clostridia bacterium]
MELKGKKVNFLGDSITEGCGASDDAHCFVQVFGRMTGTVVRNYGIGGTRIARKRVPSANPVHDQCYLDRVDQMDADADLIVIFGGTNDFGHGDAPLGTPDDTDEYTFCGAMKSLLERVMRRFPASEIVVMTPIHRRSEMVTENPVGLVTGPLELWVEAERKICSDYSIPVLDLWSVAGIYPRLEENYRQYTADGLHPNDFGMERIARRLAGFLSIL